MASTNRSVGRPRSFDENELLDRAVELFWRHGAAATTTRMLEADLGLTQSSLYNAFGSKRALLELALDRYVDHIEAAVVAPLDTEDAGIVELLGFVDNLMVWISRPDRPGCMLLNLLAEQGSADAGLVAWATAYRDRIRSACRAALDNVDAATASGRADLVVAAVLGINIAARGGAEDTELDGMATALRNLINAWT